MSIQRVVSRAVGLGTTLPLIRSSAIRAWLTTSASPPDASTLRRAKELVRKPAEGLLDISWRDNSTNQYPFMYLRDLCRCPECFHDSSLQRAFDPISGLDPNLVAPKAELSDDGKLITVTWPNDHVSSFDSDWLYERRLPNKDEQRMEKERGFMREDVVLWGSQMTSSIPSLSFSDLVNDEATQLKWLKLIGSHGIVLVKSAPSAEGQLKKLGDVLGYLMIMWFGESFRVENILSGDKNDGLSLSSVPQATCPYNDYRGGLHMVHCVQGLSAAGGEHTFVDAFNIVQHLKDNDPGYYELLRSARISYQRNVANDHAELEMTFSHPVIKLDHSGCLFRVIYNDVNRSTFINVPPEDVPNLYRAYYKVSRMIRDPGYTIQHKLSEGDIMTFDCDRVMVGRNSFAPEVKGKEVFECGYSDKDMTNSRRRILEKTLDNVRFT